MLAPVVSYFILSTPGNREEPSPHAHHVSDLIAIRPFHRSISLSLLALDNN
jgi:hypothetical protein